LQSETVRARRFLRSLKMVSGAIFFFALLAFATLIPRSLSAATDAQAAPFAGYAKYVRYRADYQVNSDGTDVETREWAMKVLTEQGVAMANQASVSFSDRLQNAEIVSAYTLKADGRRIDVPPTNFQVETNTGKDKVAPMFSDIKTKTVAFPDVAVGDTVVLSYKTIQVEPTFPGNFSMLESFAPFQVYDQAEVSLSAPESVKMQIYSRGMKVGPTEIKDGRRVWSWSYKNEQIVRPESGAVSALDYGPIVVATTFKDYGALATAYDARARSKAKVTDKVKKLADQLTASAHTPREQAKALYDWVASNLEYAPNAVGVGSVVPHDADLILANRMGDCKDHTTLLEALLAAKGIESTPVLINAGQSYTLPPAPAVDEFNHLIIYIPAFDLYADSTSKFTPFGMLPIDDSDKPVVHARNFAEIQHTPPTDPKASGYEIATAMDIHPDGSAEGETKIATDGLFSDETRAAMTYIQPNMEDTVIRESLSRGGFSGTGIMTKDDPRILSGHYTYSVKYRLDDAMNLPGPGALAVKSPLGGVGTIANFLDESNQPDRTQNFQCLGGYSREAYTIHLPKGTEVMAMPKDVQIAGKSATYKASYRQEGDTLLVSRELDDHTGGNVCTPAYAKEFKTFVAAVRRNLRAEVLYR
jgi:transglutaminase-like putative cysteine protease